MEDGSLHICQYIGYLQDKRYDANHHISEIKKKIIDIDKQELDFMKKSTIQHSELQQNYIYCNDEEDFIKNLAMEASQKMGFMNYELQSLHQQMRFEQQKLEELEEQLNKVKIRMKTAENERGENINHQQIILEEQRDQQFKLLEDIEFKELETQSKYEEECVILKRNVVETQKKFIMSFRDRENKKLILDEQQINLMKETRDELHRLDNERNHLNKQLTHYEDIINTCNLKIGELNWRLVGSEYMTSKDQTLGILQYNNQIISEDDLYTRLSDCTSNLIEEVNYNSEKITNFDKILHEKLESLTEIVRVNLNIKSNCYIDPFRSTYASQTTVNSLDYYHHQLTDSYQSIFTFPDQFTIMDKTDSTACLQYSYQPISTIENFKSNERGSSNQSQLPQNQNMCSISDLYSEISNSEDDCHHCTKYNNSRKKKKLSNNKNNKYLRPLRCVSSRLTVGFNLRTHVESCGHDLAMLKGHVQIDEDKCQGFLWKLSNKLFSVYRKRWFYFDQNQKEIKYYTSNSKHKLKGTISFQIISDVFVDHNRHKGSQTRSFCIETHTKTFYLMAAKFELVSLWVDVIFTGAEAYLNLHNHQIPSSILCQSTE